MSKREDRRDRTLRAAERHRRDHHTFCRSSRHSDCFCKPLGHYAKAGCQSHRCAGRKHGQPKIGVGCCKGHDARPSLVQRRQWRDERAQWKRWGIDRDA